MLAKKREERPKTFHDVLMELRKIKVFKTANPAPPKDGGSLFLHPEAAALRRPGGRGPLPKPPPDGKPKPPEKGEGAPNGEEEQSQAAGDQRGPQQKPDGAKDGARKVPKTPDGKPKPQG
jgi:hypothetical protein